MRWVLTLGFLLIAMTASATTGGKLNNHCKTGEGTALSSSIPFGTCLGYSTAVMEAMIANGQQGMPASHASSDNKLRRGHLGVWNACFPVKVNPGDARDVAKNFINAYPRRHNEDAVLLVAEALAKAFPCQN